MSRQTTDWLNGDARKARLRDLLHDCVASAPAEQADRIREAHALLWPEATRAGQSAERAPELRTFDAMLALGAHVSAVISLIDADTAFMLSHGANGNCLASVVVPDGSEEMVAEGSTLALALLAAYVSSLLVDVELASGDPARVNQNVAMRLN